MGNTSSQKTEQPKQKKPTDDILGDVDADISKNLSPEMIAKLNSLSHEEKKQVVKDINQAKKEYKQVTSETVKSALSENKKDKEPVKVKISQTQQEKLDTLNGQNKAKTDLLLVQQTKEYNNNIKKILNKAVKGKKTVVKEEETKAHKLMEAEHHKEKVKAEKTMEADHKKVVKVESEEKAKAHKMMEEEHKKPKESSKKPKIAYCGMWKANKKAHPDKPVDPTSGRKIMKGKTTYKALNTVCKGIKKACKDDNRNAKDTRGRILLRVCKADKL